VVEAGHGGLDCPLCEGPCVHARYSARRIAFRAAHGDAYAAAYLDAGGAASHELERLEREYRTLPPGRHLCTCRPQDCPYWTAHGGACLECRRLHDERKGIKQDVGISIGRTELVNAPTPDVDRLDEAFAQSRGFKSPGAMAAFLNGEAGEQT
jgi:hypothetical protein